MNKNTGNLIYSIKRSHKGLYKALKPMWRCVIGCKSAIHNLKWGEKRVSYGKEYDNTTFYIARRDCEYVGLFSYAIIFLHHIRYAVENGWVPIIDMKSYPNPYTEKADNKNAWEFYFLQPYYDEKKRKRIDLDHIANAKNIIIGNGGMPEKQAFNSIDMTAGLLKNPDYRIWMELAHKYLIFNDDVKKAADTEVKFEQTERILGLSLRGTDYSESSHPSGHPKQPSVELAIEVCENRLEKWSCDKIFLATEDQEILWAIKSHFGEKVITTKRNYYSSNVTYHITEHKFERENDKYLRGLEYAVQIYLLTQCNCFLGGATSGNICAILMSDYEYCEIFDLGVYE